MRSLTARRAARAADHQPRRRRPATLAVGAALTAFLATGISGADATSTTTEVAFSEVTPVRTITTGASVGANKTWSFVASAGSTTVPSNATVVRLAITVKGTKAGTLSFYPAGDPSAASPTTLSWPAGGSNAGTVNVNVGLGNKVVIANASLATATVGVKITGYSTQVTNGSINGSGGSAGQVLTNNGNGTTSWKSPPAQRTMLTARVRYSVLRPGSDAISASSPSVGDWVLTFPRSVETCAVSITTSMTETGGTAHQGTTFMRLIAAPNQVRLHAYAPDYSTQGQKLVPSPNFDVILVC